MVFESTAVSLYADNILYFTFWTDLGVVLGTSHKTRVD